jgi:hypothetical protein
LDNEIYVIPFKFKHLPLLIEIHENRDKALNTDLTMRDLPKIGYIAMLGKSCIAAGFLRRVEPNYAQLDTFLSNPYFGSQIRHLGMSLVVDSLMNEAKELNLKGILAFTKDESILKRAKDQGFHIIEQVILGKALVTPTQSR